MQYLGLLFGLGLLGVNVWGLMLGAGLFWRNRWFALVLGPLLGVTAIYAVECHHGLGPDLSWLTLASTVGSVFLIFATFSSWEPSRWGPLPFWNEGPSQPGAPNFSPRRLLGCLGVLALLFLYAFVWRFTNPDIDDSSEKIADLSFICSYYPGGTIPVADVWLSPYLSTQYYSFQHYAAALMGRLLLLPPGEAYNLGFCLIVALAGTAFCGTVCQIARKTWVRILVVCGFMIGGTGVTVLTHFTEVNATPWSDMRFIGSAPLDRAPVGKWLKDYQSRHPQRDSEGNPITMDLPGEIFAYVVYLGDYHAPLSGYCFLGLGGMAMLLWSRLRQKRYAVILGATLTWTLLSNTWVLPLQGLFVVAWLAANLRDARRLAPAVAAGAALVWLAAWGYLSAFLGLGRGLRHGHPDGSWTEHTPVPDVCPLHAPDPRADRPWACLGNPSGPEAGARLARAPHLHRIFLRR